MVAAREERTTRRGPIAPITSSASTFPRFSSTSVDRISEPLLLHSIYQTAVPSVVYCRTVSAPVQLPQCDFTRSPNIFIRVLLLVTSCYGPLACRRISVAYLPWPVVFPWRARRLSCIITTVCLRVFRSDTNPKPYVKRSKVQELTLKNHDIRRFLLVQTRHRISD